jgi:hypothetical protein
MARPEVDLATVRPAPPRSATGDENAGVSATDLRIGIDGAPAKATDAAEVESKCESARGGSRTKRKTASLKAREILPTCTVGGWLAITGCVAGAQLADVLKRHDTGDVPPRRGHCCHGEARMYVRIAAVRSLNSVTFFL